MLFMTIAVFIKINLVFLVKKELSLIIFLSITQYFSLLRKAFIIFTVFYV